MELDLKDRKLLYWLDQNSRTSNKEIGRKIGLTEQAVGYRIKRLQEKGVIKHFVPFMNTLRLGYTHYKVFIKLHNTSEETEEKIIKYLSSHSNIRWVVSMSGKYDISFSVLALSEKEFMDIYQEIEKKFGRQIIEKNVSIPLDSLGFTRAYLLNEKRSKEREYKIVEQIEKVDEVDKKILKSLSQDARKNIVDIAEEIRTSVSVVKYRLKKLIERKVIESFTLELDLEKLGYEYYSVFIYMHNVTKEVDNALVQFAQTHPGILYLIRAIGSYDLQLEFEVRNYKELDAMLKEFRKQFSVHIRDFEVLRVIKEYKYDFYPFEV